MEVKYEVKTTPLPGGTITQELYSLIDEARELLARWVIDTREEQTRQALISLGWTLPQSEGGNMSIKINMVTMEPGDSLIITHKGSAEISLSIVCYEEGIEVGGPMN